MSTDNSKSTKKSKPSENSTKKTVDAEVVSEKTHTSTASSANIDNKTLIILAHILSIVASFVPALVIYLTTEEPVVKKHAKAALNFQISLIIYIAAFMIGSVILTIITFGLFALIFPLFGLVLGAYGLIPPILAVVKANEDINDVYKYPLAIELIK